MALRLPSSEEEALDFDPAQDFLNRYQEESSDPTETDFSFSAYEGEEGRGADPQYKDSGFFSPDGSGRSDRVAIGGTSPIEGVSGHDYLNDPKYRDSDRPTTVDYPVYRSTSDSDTIPTARKSTIARDRPAVRPTGQGSVGQSRPNFRTTGRSFLGGYSRSQRTGPGVSGSTGFSSASSSNPNQSWGGYRPTNVVSSSPLSGLGVINRPSTVNLNQFEVAQGQTLYGDTDYGLQEDGTLGVGDDDWGSDIDINELENLGLGIELAKADTSNVVNQKDPLVDSMGRPLQTAQAREERIDQGVNQFGQVLDPPRESDPRDDFLSPDSGGAWLGVMEDWYNPETGQHHQSSAGNKPKEGTGWVRNPGPTYDGGGNIITPRKYPKPGDPGYEGVTNNPATVDLNKLNELPPSPTASELLEDYEPITQPSDYPYIDDDGRRYKEELVGDSLWSPGAYYKRVYEDEFIGDYSGLGGGIGEAPDLPSENPELMNAVWTNEVKF